MEGISSMTKDFQEIVVRDVKEDASPDDSGWLRLPENLDQWWEHLIQFKRDLERQAATRKAIFYKAKAEAWDRHGKVYDTFEADMALSEYHKWKSSIQPILKSIESKIREAKRLRKKKNTQNSKYFNNMWRLVNMAEALVPDDHSWHSILKEIREKQTKEKQNV